MIRRLLILAFVAAAALLPAVANRGHAQPAPEREHLQWAVVAVPARPAVDTMSVPAVDTTSVRTQGEMRSALLFGADPLLSPSFPAAASGEARSVPLAFGLSAVVPGLGQAYNRDWIKTAAAVALEAGLLAGYLIWNSHGADEEEAYKAYAHAHWDPGQYATWLNDYVVFLEEERGASIGVNPIDVPGNVDFSSPEAWSAADRQAVRAFFDRIRFVEERVFHPETGASFSHKLPQFAEQQYYELIGKYFQFAPGWTDYPEWKVGGEFTPAIDPELTGPGGGKPNVQGRFLEYADDHAHANTLLRRASRVSSVIVLNHIVAAFDAAISAKLHNDRLGAGVRLALDPANEPQLVATLRLHF